VFLALESLDLVILLVVVAVIRKKIVVLPTVRFSFSSRAGVSFLAIGIGSRKARQPRTMFPAHPSGAQALDFCGLQFISCAACFPPCKLGFSAALVLD
jgi:hypothetical protein